MASKRHFKRRSCQTKIKHTSEQSARRHTFYLGKSLYHFYRCNFCGGWHVGRPRGKKLAKWMKFTYN